MKKTVKAWAVIRNGFGSLEYVRLSETNAYIMKDKHWADLKVVPCTITYDL